MSINHERRAQAPTNLPEEQNHVTDTYVTPDTAEGATRLNPNVRHANTQETFTPEEISRASGISEKHPGYNKMIAAGVVGGLGALAAAGLGVFGYKKMTEVDLSDVQNALNNRPVAEAYQDPTIGTEYDTSSIDVAATPHDTFANLPHGIQLDKCIPYVQENIARATEEWRDGLERINAPPMRGDIAREVSATNTGQEIVNRSTAKTFMYWNDTDINRAQNLVACNAIPGSGIYNFESRPIGSGENTVPTIYTAWEETDVYVSGAIAGVEANGQETKIVKIGERSTGRVFLAAYKLFQGHENPDMKEWILVSSISADSPNFILDDISTKEPTFN